MLLTPVHPIPRYDDLTQTSCTLEIGSKSKSDNEDPCFPQVKPDRTDDFRMDLSDPLPHLMAHPEPESLPKPQEVSRHLDSRRTDPGGKESGIVEEL